MKKWAVDDNEKGRPLAFPVGESDWSNHDEWCQPPAPNLTLIPPLWELIQGLVRLQNGIYESPSFRLNVLPFGTRIWRGSERGDTKHRCVPLPQSNGLCHTGRNPWRLGQKERKQVLLLLPSSYQTLSSGVGQVPSLLLDFPFGARKDGLGLK
jgi:hypothetical protein